MDTSIRIDDRQVEIQLERLRDAVQGRGSLAAMQAVGRYGKTSTQFRFRDQKGPDGKRWIPSEPALKRGGQTLRRTNRLFRSLTWRATPGEASWGTNVVYARVHQYGIATIVKVRQHKRREYITRPDGSRSLIMVEVPAHERPMLMHRRPYLGFSLYDRSEIWEILREHILEATKA